MFSTTQNPTPPGPDKWVVLKFGGTSVAGRQQWDAILSITRARQQEGFRVLLVCSAVAGVTNLLNALAYKPDSARRRQELIGMHRQLAHALGILDRDWLPAAEKKLDALLRDLIGNPSPMHRAALLAVGEWLSTRIGSIFISRHIETSWVDAREALQSLPDSDQSPARQWLSAACAAKASPALARQWAELAPVLVTQGFVARDASGRTVLLGRGGSDTSAALLAGRLSAARLEIWTDVPGLFSADPRLLEDARLLRRVGYAEALEMAASGARVVHPRCIRAAAETGTPLEIRDINRQHVPGTLIGRRFSGAPGVKAVTCQQHMAVLLLQNLDARFQVGFLAGVFETIRLRGISVDLVATSETTTTLAIHCESNHLGPGELDALVTDLSTLCKVRLFRDCVCVNLVGQGVRTALSRLHAVMDWFESRPLLMASQSANDLCLSLLVEAGEHEQLLRGAHAALIPAVGPAASEKTVFGPSWKQIQPLTGEARDA